MNILHTEILTGSPMFVTMTTRVMIYIGAAKLIFDPMKKLHKDCYFPKEEIVGKGK